MAFFRTTFNNMNNFRLSHVCQHDSPKAITRLLLEWSLSLSASLAWWRSLSTFV
jgi:hypothetical protein